jgi:hypothetical protein
MKKIFLFIFIGISLNAWDGYDYDKSSYVEIDSGNLVRSGNDIEIYDYGSGEYKDVEVQSVESYGGSTEVEVYDYNTGEYRTLEMD